jgi:hypothetical protein
MAVFTPVTTLLLHAGTAEARFARRAVDAPCLARTLEPRPGLVPSRRVASRESGQARGAARSYRRFRRASKRSCSDMSSHRRARRWRPRRPKTRRSIRAMPTPPSPSVEREVGRSTALPYLLSAAESLQVGGNVYYHVEPRAGTELGGALCDRPCDLYASRLQPSRPALR